MTANVILIPVAPGELIDKITILKIKSERISDSDKDFGELFLETARAIYRTNDERAAIKKEINLHLGSQIVEEKSYANY